MTNPPKRMNDSHFEGISPVGIAGRPPTGVPDDRFSAKILSGTTEYQHR
jgi:hypothetical protein